jgi:hypothetical protein
MSESLVGTRVIAKWGAMFPLQEGVVVSDMGENVKIVFDAFEYEEEMDDGPFETIAITEKIRDYSDYVNRQIVGSPIGIYWL